MSTDDRDETITDRAAIRDSADEREPERVCCDGGHANFPPLPDDPETTPEQRAGLDEVLAKVWPDPAPGATVAALNLDAMHETICDKFTGMAEVQQAADALVAEVRSLRANWRMVTTALGYGDGITEPQIEHRDFVAECERQFAEASEWRESQRWRDECHEAGHPDDEDCYEHDPVLALVALRAKVAAVEAHPVVLELAEERTRQTAKHGDQSHLPDGTGAALWLSMDDDYIRRHGIRRDNLAAWAKARTDEASQASGDGSITFEHILTEEWAEAIAESDPDALRAELVQVAAVAVQWVEAIDLRAALATGEGK